jgi:tripartite-type tricarboxylate transporter receptor subunit TctC
MVLNRRHTLLGSMALLPTLSFAQATDWPNRPVRYIIPFAPGGATDTLSRLYCARMGELAGQTFVVDNRAGAGGIIGTDAIAKAPADGYTIGLGSIAVHAIAPSLYAKLPFDAGRDFTMISGLWQMPNLLVVNNDVQAKTLPELLALIRQHPERFSYASAGNGTTLHLTGAMLTQALGVQMTHVPYRGTPPAWLDLAAGRVQLMFDNMPNALVQVRAGKARAIAVTSVQRNPAAPEIPTMSETLPGFELMTWNMLAGPPNLPPAVLARISALTKQAVESPIFGKALSELGAVPWWTTTEEATAYRAAQEAMLAPIVRASGARVE